MALDFKTISQRKWTRGLQATFGLFAEPDQILKRISNLVYTRRGALKVTDGSQIFTSRNGVTQVADAPILEIALYSPTTTGRYYLGIQAGALANLPLVTGLTATNLTLGGNILSIQRTGGIVTVTLDSSALIPDTQFPPTTIIPFLCGNILISGTTNYNGLIDAAQLTFVSAVSSSNCTFTYLSAGTTPAEAAGNWAPATPLTAGTYTFDVTAGDAQGGETPGTGAPLAVVLAGAQNAIMLQWNPVTGASGYVLYTATGRVNNGANRLIPTANALVPTPALVYLGYQNNPGAVPPVANNTAVAGNCIFWKFDTPSYVIQLGTLPPAPIIALAPPPGGGTGSGSGSTGQNPNATSQGGVVGFCSPTPMVTPFQNAMMIAAGNGVVPMYYTDGGALQIIGNNFTAIYPDWQPSVVQNVGDNIVDSVSGGVFTCTQGGTTGATRPTFNNSLQAGTADNTVVWQCTATKYQGQPLRGAAHAIVYAGSLWIANTYPTTTSDEQDGPSCIKMSDLGNFQSWNPINVAMVNRDDGDEITGLAQFTIAELGITPTGNLVVFKNFQTYQITGVFGASDFSIQQSKSDMGCVASRSIQFLSGFGQIARLAHMGFAMFDGTNDKVFSEEIRPYLFGDPNQPDINGVDWSYVYFSKAAQSSNPPMYLCACPVLAKVLAGVTVTGQLTTAPLVPLFVKVVQIVDGVVNAITPEVQVLVSNTGAARGITVTTPPAAPGVVYRVYTGYVSGNENRYAQAASYTATFVSLGPMTAGVPSVGAGGLTRIFAYDLVQKNWTIIDLPFPISALKQIRTGGTQPLTVCGGWSDSTLRRLFAGDTTWDGAGVLWSLEGGEIFQQGGSGKIYYRKVVIRGSAVTELTIDVAANIQGKNGTVKAAPQVQLGPQQWDARLDICMDGENANIAISGQGQTTIDSVDWYVKPKTPGAPVSAQK
jgi:hypothetical protein